MKQTPTYHLPTALFLTAAFSVPTALAAPLGTLHAEAECEAYVSKNSKTNPDMLKTSPGTDYPVLQLNKPEAPDYYQIEAPGAAVTSARWVSADCGKYAAADAASAKPAPEPAQPEETGNVCRTANQADSIILDLSWQPAFCESHSDRKECANTDPGSFQANNFALHGMWPNRKDCGQRQGYYAFCGAIKSPVQEGFCGYPAVALESSVRERLGGVMPSVVVGSCLERHEWHKHGTCGTWTPDEYFILATRLTREFNESGMGQYMSEHAGVTVMTVELNRQLDKSLGEGAQRHVSLLCNKHGLLTDISINLPPRIDPKTDLKTLIAQGPDRPGPGSCSSSIRIDAIGQ